MKKQITRTVCLMVEIVGGKIKWTVFTEKSFHFIEKMHFTTLSFFLFYGKKYNESYLLSGYSKFCKKPNLMCAKKL